MVYEVIIALTIIVSQP